MGQLEIWLEGGRHRWVVNWRWRDGACSHFEEKKGRYCRPATWGESKERSSSREREDEDHIERTRLVIIPRLVHCRLFGTTAPIVVFQFGTTGYQSRALSHPPDDPAPRSVYCPPPRKALYGIQTRSRKRSIVARDRGREGGFFTQARARAVISMVCSAEYHADA